MPASTMAFASLDLHPGYAQRLKLKSIGDRIVNAGGKSYYSADKDIEELPALVAPSLTATSTRDWFGGRISMGLWQQGDTPVTLSALASDDDAKARTSLTKAQQDAGGPGKLGFTLSDGYVLVAKADKDAQQAVEAAATEAKAHPLGKRPEYRSAVDKLDGDHLLTAWVNMGDLGKVTTAAMMAVPELKADPAQRAMITKQLATMTGQLAVGGQATDDGLEIALRGVGQPVRPASTDNACKDLDALPAGSAIAVATSVPAEVMKQAATAAQKSAAGAAGVQDPRAVAMINKLLAQLANVRTVVGAAKFDGEKMGGFQLNLGMVNPAAAATLNALLRPFLPSTGATMTTSGATATFTAKGLGAGHLSDSAEYRKVMAGMPAKADFAMYADLAALPHSGADTAQLAAFTGFGGAVDQQDDEIVGLFRLGVK